VFFLNTDKKIKMKQFFQAIFILALIPQPALFSQSCSGSALFHQGKQFVFLVEMPDYSGTNNGSSNSTAEQKTKKIKKTYMIDSVKKEGGILHASIKVLKSENLATDPTEKSALSQSNLTSISCNGQTIAYTTSVQTSTMNLNIVSEFPMGMRVGDKLKDQTIVIPAGKKSGSSEITVVMHRSVSSEELVTTPAGKWNCFKIAQTSTTQIAGKNGGQPTVINDPTLSYTWFAPEMGIIKMTSGQKITYTLVDLP
jgi:hypothetical protein